MWYPGSRGHILTEDMFFFGRFSASPPHQDRPAALGRILNYSRLAFKFTRLVVGLLCLQHFAGESPGEASRQFPGMGLASGGIHLQDLPLILLLPRGRRGKNDAFIV